MAGLICAATLSSFAFAQSPCPGGAPPAAFIDSAASEVVVVRAGGTHVAVAPDLPLCPGDEVRTGSTGRAAIRFDDKRTLIRLDGNSLARIQAGSGPDGDVSLLSGVLYFISSVRTHFQVDTPYIVAGIDGTEALVGVKPGEALALAAVREGVVSASDRAGPGGTVKVGVGEAAFRSADVAFAKAPIGQLPPQFRDLLIVSSASVDWAVYYPPIMLAEDVRDPHVRRAVQLLSSGDYDRAAAELDRAGPSAQGSAAALRTIIAIGRDDAADAMTWADRALTTDPQSPQAAIAASYARQAAGDVGGALDYARQAAGLAPGDAYVLARLAELEMTVGDRSAAYRTAERSLAIRRTPLALFVAGLALLANARYEQAEALFREAILLDPEAPLARLGLGLVKIRRGETSAGAWELERAVAHDPRRSALRNWLGRAYFDEGLTGKAADQFRLAAEADPEDPTPHLFSALERYAANSPIEALRELYEAEERTRYRNVLRSERGLAEDDATLGAALGRIYETLEFEKQAQTTGAAAVDADPANPGAHRFFAESLRSEPGYEIAQTSELLRSQMLSPPSKTPVQPQLLETGLALLETTGPARTSFAEFSPLFDADGVRLDISGLAGTQDTFADEVSLTLLARGFSASIGQLHYETDGFQDNNDVDHDILAATTTLSVAPWLDLFGEYRWRDTQAGDRRVLFSPDDLSDSLRIGFERELARVGFHAMPAEGHDILGLFTHGTLKTGTTEADPFDPSFVFVTDTFETINEAQLQYIGQFGPHSLQVGGSASQVTGREIVGVEAFPDADLRTPVDAAQANAYAYAVLRYPSAFEWTLGFSVDRIDQEDDYERETFNPKLGLRWRVTDSLTLRGAYFSTLKRRLVADQTLEPTAVAGFPQFLDTFNGTRTERVGLGADLRVTRALSVGAEALFDRMDAPGDGNSTVEDTRLRGYVDATFGDRLAIAFAPAWADLTSDILFVFPEVETLELPLTASLFHPSGLFGAVRGTFVVQDATDGAGTETHDEFFLVDASLGYRFPDRRGVASIEARNIFDSDVGYIERTLVDDFTADRRFAPERTVMGRVSVRF